MNIPGWRCDVALSFLRFEKMMPCIGCGVSGGNRKSEIGMCFLFTTVRESKHYVPVRTVGVQYCTSTNQMQIVSNIFELES